MGRSTRTLSGERSEPDFVLNAREHSLQPGKPQLAPPAALLVVAQSKDCMFGLTGVRVADPGQTLRRERVGRWVGGGK